MDDPDWSEEGHQNLSKQLREAQAKAADTVANAIVLLESALSAEFNPQIAEAKCPLATHTIRIAKNALKRSAQHVADARTAEEKRRRHNKYPKGNPPKPQVSRELFPDFAEKRQTPSSSSSELTTDDDSPDDDDQENVAKRLRKANLDAPDKTITVAERDQNTKKDATWGPGVFLTHRGAKAKWRNEVTMEAALAPNELEKSVENIRAEMAEKDATIRELQQMADGSDGAFDTSEVIQQARQSILKLKFDKLAFKTTMHLSHLSLFQLRNQLTDILLDLPLNTQLFAVTLNVATQIDNWNFQQDASLLALLLLSIFNSANDESWATQVFQCASSRALFTGALQYKPTGAMTIAARSNNLLDAIRETAALAAQRLEWHHGPNFAFSSTQCEEAFKNECRVSTLRSIRRAIHNHGSGTHSKWRSECSIPKDKKNQAKKRKNAKHKPKRCPKKARKGDITQFAGPSSSGEFPENSKTFLEKLTSKIEFMFIDSENSNNSDLIYLENRIEKVAKSHTRQLRHSKNLKPHVSHLLKPGIPTGLHNTMRSRSVDPMKTFSCLMRNAQKDLVPKLYYRDTFPEFH